MTTKIQNKAAKLMLTLCVFLSAVAMSAQPQNRNYIKSQIEEWGQCRNVAITQHNGDLALYGGNGWATSGCPDNLVETIKGLNNNNEFIDDVQLTEQGRWVILYGKNGALWNGIPASLEAKIREFNDADETITTLTFNDGGDWIVISTDHISTSDEEVSQWLADGTEEYGKLWTACLSEDGLVAVYESGYKFFGNVPESLKKALNKSDLNVYRLKIAGSSWFFADKDGNYQYNM